MLLFMDGQGHYITGEFPLKYSSVRDDFCTWEITNEGRFNNCIKRTSTSNLTQPGYLAIAPLMTRLGAWTPTASGVQGFAIRVTNLAHAAHTAVADAIGLFVVMDGDVYHVKVELNPDGTLSLYRNADATPNLIANSIEALQEDVWAFIEFKWLISSTVGAFQIKVNGVQVMNFSGDTKSHSVFPALAEWTSTRFLGVTAASPVDLVIRASDLYLADLEFSDSDDVHDFLGDGTIDTIVADGVGNSSDWTPSAGANWQNIHDLPGNDGDATYNAATDPDLVDTYTFEDIALTAVVKGVHVNIIGRKVTVGTSSVAPVVRTGGTDFVGPTQGIASLEYDRYLTQPYDINPDTGAKFTPTEVNAAEFGVKKIS